MTLSKSINTYPSDMQCNNTLNSISLINEYSSNNNKYNKVMTNEIINISLKRNRNEINQILNADLLSKKIKLKLKSKEIGNKNVKLTIFKIFNNFNKKYKTINTAMLNNKYKVNN